jgi:hypothetical protein
MSPADFRQLALSLPEATEAAHMNHPDFRVGGKIFATLPDPEQCVAVLMLTLEQQRQLIDDEPDVFAPVKGGWGERGATEVQLEIANRQTLAAALALAWRKRAPKSLATRVGLSGKLP